MSFIYERMTKYTFVEAFKRMGRGGHFTYGALQAMFEHYEQMAEDLGDPVELDPVAICCDWSEYDDIEKAASDLVPDSAYSDPGVFDEQEAIEYLIDHTIFIEGDGFILIQSY